MSDDIKHFREAVAKFDELKLELEDLKERLESNFKNYKNISDISSDISEKNQAVLESINTLQITATDSVETAFKKTTDLKAEMAKYYSAENTKIKKDFDALMSDIQNELSELESTIKTNIQSAINNVNIDTSHLSKVIDNKIGKLDFSELNDIVNKTNKNVDSVVENFTDSITKIKQINNKLKNSIASVDNKTKEINDAIYNFNNISKSMSRTKILAMLFTGIIIGASLMTFFKINAISNFYFAGYDNKLEKLEIDNKQCKDLDKLSTFLKEHSIYIKGGIYTGTNVPFIKIKNTYRYKTKYTFDRVEKVVVEGRSYGNSDMHYVGIDQ